MIISTSFYRSSGTRRSGGSASAWEVVAVTTFLLGLLMLTSTGSNLTAAPLTGATGPYSNHSASVGMASGWRSTPNQARQDQARQDPVRPTPEQRPGERPPNPTPPENQPRQTKTDRQPDPPDPDAEAIRIDSTLVVVPVSVTDQSGQPIRDLEAEDFILEEEGAKQQVQMLGDPGKTPIELGLLFDVSRSVRNRFDFEKTAAAKFLEVVLKDGDHASLFLIGHSSRLLVERTGSAAKAVSAALAIEPTDEATAFFDTVVKAARYIEENAATGARKVLVVISDGEDNNSENFLLREALVEAQGRNCLFYAINPSGPSIRLNRMSIRGHEGMVRIANETGGMAFLPDRIEDLTQVFNHIAAELQAQYLLGYYPSNEVNDGRFRRIKVRVHNRAELRIRARQGYYSAK